MRFPIYLDYNATTPLDERVFEVMKPYFFERFGNAASAGHLFGDTARSAVEQARETIARVIGAESPSEIIFTSGATESDNLAIKGVAEAMHHKGNHIITCAVEHKAVLDTCKSLEKKGCTLTVLGVDANGCINIDELKASITPKTILVSIMHGNNEIGTVEPIEEIGTFCREHDIIFHTDSTQSAGKIPFNVAEMNVDLASLTAHKIYGPKGVGALYVRSGCSLLGQIDGGGHERGMRSGTLNVPGIVGLAASLSIAVEERSRDAEHCTSLRNRLWQTIKSATNNALCNGPDPLLTPHKRLPNNLSVSIAGTDGELIAGNLYNVAYSSRSACTSAAGGLSHVLKAIGRTDETLTTLRFGVGRFTTEEEIDYTIERINEAVA